MTSRGQKKKDRSANKSNENSPTTVFNLYIPDLESLNDGNLDQKCEQKNKLKKLNSRKKHIEQERTYLHDKSHANLSECESEETDIDLSDVGSVDQSNRHVRTSISLLAFDWNAYIEEAKIDSKLPHERVSDLCKSGRSKCEKRCNSTSVIPELTKMTRAVSEGKPKRRKPVKRRKSTDNSLLQRNDISKSHSLKEHLSNANNKHGMREIEKSTAERSDSTSVSRQSKFHDSLASNEALDGMSLEEALEEEGTPKRRKSSARMSQSAGQLERKRKVRRSKSNDNIVSLISPRMLPEGILEEKGDEIIKKFEKHSLLEEVSDLENNDMIPKTVSVSCCKNYSEDNLDSNDVTEFLQFNAEGNQKDGKGSEQKSNGKRNEKSETKKGNVIKVAKKVRRKEKAKDEKNNKTKKDNTKNDKKEKKKEKEKSSKSTNLEDLSKNLDRKDDISAGSTVQNNIKKKVGALVNNINFKVKKGHDEYQIQRTDDDEQQHLVEDKKDENDISVGSTVQNNIKKKVGALVSSISFKVKKSHDEYQIGMTDDDDEQLLLNVVEYIPNIQPEKNRNIRANAA